jgi:hypothetical protein
MGARAGAIAVVLILWVGVRFAIRRPLFHPWLAAMVLTGTSASVGSASEALAGRAGHAAYSLAFLLGFAGLVAFAEGLKTELGAPASSRSRIALLAGICLVVAIVCGLVSTPRDHLIGDLTGSAFLLNLLGMLFTARQRRVGSTLIAAGIIAYACTRTVLLGLRLRGVDVFSTEHVFDLAVIVLLGLGLIVFVIEGSRKPRCAGSR